VVFRRPIAPVPIRVLLTVRVPVVDAIAIQLRRDTSQEGCPWNVKFARALPAVSPYSARGVLAGRDARTLATRILAMDDDAHRTAFRGSAMKRAKVAGLQRNARVVRGNRTAGSGEPAG
jgi:epoxyqueuosine reductase